MNINMQTAVSEPLHQAWAFFVGLLKLKRYSQTQQKKPAPQQSNVVSYENVGGQYRTIKDLLTDLDSVFKQLGRFKPKNKSALRLVKRYGPFIMALYKTQRDFIYTHELEGFKAYGLPTFLIGYFDPIHQPDPENCMHWFLCASKCNALAYVGKKPGHVYYEVTHVVMPDKDSAKKISMAKPEEFDYYIEVNEITGAVTAIKTPWIKTIAIPRSKRRRTVGGAPKMTTKSWRNGSSGSNAGCGPVTYIKKQVWDRPDFMDGCDHHSEAEKKNDLEERFCLTYNCIMRRELGVNIIVKKGNSRATFIVPQNRWKYFFRDRVDVKTPSGRKRPIFHAVVAHKRDLKSGKTSYVKTHYRGSRHFWWGSYEILITMQGKHSKSQAGLDVALTCEEDTNEPCVSIFGETAKQINRTFEGDAA